MLRTPQSSDKTDMLERMSPDQILGIFESCLKTGSAKLMQRELTDAWGILFSHVYLSAEELVHDMQAGEHSLGEEKERMLREFVRVDCAGGGAFVMNVINKGAKIDRAALTMIADLRNLAGLEYGGRTALHMLADSCDKKVRPALIEKAGQTLLSKVYDSRKIPVLFTILGLADLTKDDLDAIARVFSRDDLRKVMSGTRTGKNALEVFTEASRVLKNRAPGERNKFDLNRAVRTTNPGGAIMSQGSSPGSRSASGSQERRPVNGNNPEEGPVKTISEQYDGLMVSPLDNINVLMQRKPGGR